MKKIENCISFTFEKPALVNVQQFFVIDDRLIHWQPHHLQPNTFSGQKWPRLCKFPHGDFLCGPWTYISVSLNLQMSNNSLSRRRKPDNPRTGPRRWAKGTMQGSPCAATTEPELYNSVTQTHVTFTPRPRRPAANQKWRRSVGENINSHKTNNQLRWLFICLNQLKKDAFGHGDVNSWREKKQKTLPLPWQPHYGHQIHWGVKVQAHRDALNWYHCTIWTTGGRSNNNRALGLIYRRRCVAMRRAGPCLSVCYISGSALHATKLISSE